MDLHEIFLASQIAGKSNGGSENIDLSDYYTKSQISNLLSDKVDKISGKGLSTNDFTNAAKSKLDNLSNYDDADVKVDIANTAEQTALNRDTLGYQRKNLLKNTAKSRTAFGVSFTVNDDGSVTATGTAIDNIVFKLGDISPNGEKNYIISGCPAGGTYLTYQLCCRNADGGIQGTYEYGNGAEFTISEDFGVYIRIGTGTAVENLTFYPMIRDAAVADNTYEPYKHSVIEHFENKVDKISGKELSTNDFTNVLKKKLDSLENYDDTQIKSEISTLSNKKYLNEQSIPSGADLNDYISENFQVYCTGSQAITQTILNRPADVNDNRFTLETWKNGSYNYIQRLTHCAYSTARPPVIYIRSCSGGSSSAPDLIWSDWYKFEPVKV